MIKSLTLLLLCGVIGLSFGFHDEDWHLGNCLEKDGVITDILCCEGENFCTKISNEEKCNSKGDPYCVWVDDKCRPYEDSASNVCCMEKDVKDGCSSVLKGQCPADFQVDEECCQDRKYGFFESEDGKVCCNAPCKEMEKNNCTDRLPAKCGPQQRSFAIYNPYQMLGFPQPHGPPSKHKFGSIIHGTGYGYDMGYGYRRYKPEKHGYEEEDDFDYSKDSHVDEVTMDDVMTLLIEGLEKQTDVKVYDADITSDPYLGKKKSGGLFLDHHFPHADKFFDEIYGERGQYDHFIRPFEGYAKVYPEYEVKRQPHYAPYHYPDYPTPHYQMPMYPSYQSYPSYPEYEPEHSYHGYGPMGYDLGYPSGYPSHDYGYESYEPKDHPW